MNYEEKYKDALERAKKEWSSNLDNANKNYRQRLEIIFPELKEAEDEKIRKDIISYLRNEKVVKRYISDIEVDKWIDWLEKQGEQEQDPCGRCKDKCLNCHNFPCIEKRLFEQGKSAPETIKEEKVDECFLKG